MSGNVLCSSSIYFQIKILHIMYPLICGLSHSLHSFSTAAVMTLSMAGVCTICGQVLQVLHILFHAVTAPIIKTNQCLDDNQDSVIFISMREYYLNYCHHQGLRACHSVYHVVFHDYLINQPWCVLCVLSTFNNILYCQM